MSDNITMSSGVRDIDIREALRQTTLKHYYGDGQSRVVEELGIEYGKFRIDIAVINGALLGIEIKSETDDLSRLANQARAYNLVFDYLTLVIHERHIRSAETFSDIRTWGIVLVPKTANRDDVQLEEIRETQFNSHTDSISVARLLWRDEAIDILARHTASNRVRSARRDELVSRLSEALSPAELRTEVRAALKARRNWRVGQPLM